MSSPTIFYASSYAKEILSSFLSLLSSVSFKTVSKDAFTVRVRMYSVRPYWLMYIRTYVRTRTEYGGPRQKHSERFQCE